MLKTIEDIANYLGAYEPTNTSISRRVYKDTACGAWAEVTDDGWFRVGSIVEGTDAEVPAEEVKLPCTEEDVDRAVESVEAAANDIWLASHGCAGCDKLTGGDGAVHPECPDCGGNGTVI